MKSFHAHLKHFKCVCVWVRNKTANLSIIWNNLTCQMWIHLTFHLIRILVQHFYFIIWYRVLEITQIVRKDMRMSHEEYMRCKCFLHIWINTRSWDIRWYELYSTILTHSQILLLLLFSFIVIIIIIRYCSKWVEMRNVFEEIKGNAKQKEREEKFYVYCVWHHQHILSHSHRIYILWRNHTQ